ncbi:MAG: hypothetical protein Q9220_003320 [cf. Caloplaca sp. 1 TL-2023]
MSAVLSAIGARFVYFHPFSLMKVRGDDEGARGGSVRDDIWGSGGEDPGGHGAAKEMPEDEAGDEAFACESGEGNRCMEGIMGGDAEVLISWCTVRHTVERAAAVRPTSP